MSPEEPGLCLGHDCVLSVGVRSVRGILTIRWAGLVPGPQRRQVASKEVA